MSQTDTDFAAQVAVNLITEVFKSCLSGVAGADRWLRSKTREFDPLGTAARRYAEQFERRYNAVRVFGMNQPVPLRSIYVNVNVLHKITAQLRASVEDLERFLDYDRRSFGNMLQRSGGLDAVKKYRKLIVLGKPGAGKTTFLKHIALHALDGHLPTPQIPVFISLKDWSDSKEPLQQYIIRQFEICSFPNAQLFVTRILEKGRTMLLFDGLDEVTENVDEAIRQLRDFTDQYPECQHIISCRIAAYNYVFDTFTDIEIADFDEEHIRRFIHNWFGHGSRKAEVCWRVLASEPPTRELAAVPLLLTLLCLAFDEAMEFPANRAELYKEAIDALLKKWDSTRAIKRDNPYKRLTLKHKESLLSRIAVQAFEQKQYFLPRRVIVEQIGTYLQHVKGANAEDEVDPETILQSILSQHGLFVERAKGIFSFLHLTFHEYFVARYIVDHQSKRAVQKLIETHWKDRRWREVILLTAGMLPEADELIWHILRAIDDVKSGPALKSCATFVSMIPDLMDLERRLTFSEKELDECHSVVDSVKEYWVKEQDFEKAAATRDSEREIQKLIVLKHRANGTQETGKSKSNAAAVSIYRDYSYMIDLLRQCVRSDCFMTNPTRTQVQRELCFWDELTEIGDRLVIR